MKYPGMRILTCSQCSSDFGHGTTQVFRKIVFNFCAFCWLRRRPEYNEFMRKVAA